MVRIIDGKKYCKRVVEKCLLRFLENGKYGQKSMPVKWLIGEIISAGVRGEELQEIFENSKDYPKDKTERGLYSQAFKACQELNLFGKDKCEICGKRTDETYRCLPKLGSEFEKLFQKSNKICLTTCYECFNKIKSGEISLEEIEEKVRPV